MNLASGERILVVESDPDISDLISRQALVPLGYQTRVLCEAAAAIQQARRDPPDLIIANLNLPDLSGKDLLTALTSQGLAVPVVAVMEKGQEQGAIQALRLGAADVLFWPARDTEVVRVVERGLQQRRATRGHERLIKRMELEQGVLEQRLRDIARVLDFSRSLLSTTDRQQLFGSLLELTLQIAEADIAWLLVRTEGTATFLLRAFRNLPQGWARKLNQPLDDGLSSLVALSGQPLTIHGEALERFKTAVLGKSAAVLPVKAREEVIGVLTVVRVDDCAIKDETARLLQSLADFAAIALVQERLFRAVGAPRANGAIQGAKRDQEELESLRASIRDEYRVLAKPLESVLRGKTRLLSREQQQAIRAVRRSLDRLAHSAETGAGKESA